MADRTSVEEIENERLPVIIGYVMSCCTLHYNLLTYEFVPKTDWPESQTIQRTNSLELSFV